MSLPSTGVRPPPAAVPPDPGRSCTDIIIKGAISKAEVDRLNAHLDALPRPRMGEWIGRAHVTATGGSGRAHGADGSDATATVEQQEEEGTPGRDRTSARRARYIMLR